MRLKNFASDCLSGLLKVRIEAVDSIHQDAGAVRIQTAEGITLPVLRGVPDARPAEGAVDGIHQLQQLRHGQILRKGNGCGDLDIIGQFLQLLPDGGFVIVRHRIDRIAGPLDDVARQITGLERPGHGQASAIQGSRSVFALSGIEAIAVQIQLIAPQTGFGDQGIVVDIAGMKQFRVGHKVEVKVAAGLVIGVDLGIIVSSFQQRQRAEKDSGGQGCCQGNCDQNRNGPVPPQRATYLPEFRPVRFRRGSLAPVLIQILADQPVFFQLLLHQGAFLRGCGAGPEVGKGVVKTHNLVPPIPVSDFAADGRALF